MVSALIPGLSGPGSSPGWGHCVVFLGKTLSPPRSINGYQRIVGENLTNCRGVTCNGLASRLGGVEILLAALCYRNWDKLWPNEPVGSKGFTFINMYINASADFSVLNRSTTTIINLDSTN